MTKNTTDDEISASLIDAARAYAARAEENGTPPSISRHALTATETVTLVSELLRAADLNVFDLAMWFRRQS